MRNRQLSPVIHIEPMQCHLAKSWKQKRDWRVLRTSNRQCPRNSAEGIDMEVLQLVSFVKPQTGQSGKEVSQP